MLVGFTCLCVDDDASVPPLFMCVAKHFLKNSTAAALVNKHPKVLRRRTRRTTGLTRATKSCWMHPRVCTFHRWSSAVAEVRVPCLSSCYVFPRVLLCLAVSCCVLLCLTPVVFSGFLGVSRWAKRGRGGFVAGVGAGGKRGEEIVVAAARACNHTGEGGIL